VEPAPAVGWTEDGEERSARWRSERGAPPPRKVVIVDDRITADEAYGLAAQGVGLLWRGDYPNARQLLTAMASRADRKAARKPHAAAAGAEAFNLERQARAQQSERVTILLNKPIGLVSGQAEQGYRPAVTLLTAATRWTDDRAPHEFHPRQLRGLAPAGRLDIDSTGLLVFTQDGRIARQLVGADSAIEKEYLVRVAGTLSSAELGRLNHGLSLDGAALKPATVSWLNADQLRFVLREGKKRQIRRMCEQVGLEVLGLKRVRIGRVMLGHLPSGQWRYLGDDEQF